MNAPSGAGFGHWSFAAGWQANFREGIRLPPKGAPNSSGLTAAGTHFRPDQQVILDKSEALRNGAISCVIVFGCDWGGFRAHCYGETGSGDGELSVESLGEV